MKKYLFFAAALFVLVACNNNEPKNMALRKVTLHATVENGGANGPHRIAPVDPTAESVSFTWEAGDQVTIKTDAGCYTLTATNIQGNQADFEGEVAGDLSSYTAYYGYNPEAEGQTLTYVPNSFKPCVSGEGANDNFMLDNFYPVLKLQLKGEYTLGKIEYLLGSEVKATMPIDGGIALNTTLATDIYLPVADVSDAGFSLKFYDTEDALIIEKASTYNLTEQTGKIVTMPELEMKVVAPINWTKSLSLGKEVFTAAEAISIETGVDVSGYTEDDTHKPLNNENTLWEYLDGTTLRIQTPASQINSSLEGIFSEYHLVRSVTGLQYIHATTAKGMFLNCGALHEIDFSGFNTEDITDMSQMFSACLSLFLLNLSGFNTEKVTNMSEMFNYCTSLKSLNISGFNTANVTDMSKMFMECSALQSLTLSNNFKVAETNTDMFKNCGPTDKGCAVIGVTDFDIKTALINASGWDTYHMRFAE